MNWQFNEAAAKNQINAQVEVNQHARAISLWIAHSDDRDFRDNQWAEQTLGIIRGSSHATTSIPLPQSGYQAFLMEIDLQTDTGHDYKLSTMAKVAPDTKPCHCWSAGP